MKFNAGLAILIAVMTLHVRMAFAVEELTLQQMLARVLENYPTLEIAVLQTEQAKQEIEKAESRLGWNLNTQAGIGHDVNFFNSPTDRVDATIALRKQLESGSQVNLTGQYTYEDASSSFGPTIPDPVQRTNIDLSYRVPMGKGQDNAAYHQAIRNAMTTEALQTATQDGVIDDLARQVVVIYFDVAVTYMRLDDIEKAIGRLTRLKNYIRKNYSLGLAEEKDILQVDAQLKRQIAQRDSLKVIWGKQQVEVGRLIGGKEGYVFRPVVSSEYMLSESEKGKLLEKIYEGSPALLTQKAQLEFADAELVLAKDGKEDQFDFIMSVGMRKLHGDVATGTYSQDELAGSARIEYAFELDKRGLDARLYQAMLRKESAETEYKRIKYDLEYQLVGQLGQIEANRVALSSNKVSLNYEENKLKEAVSRYREGRSTTKELIDFENDLQTSSLTYESQKIETAKAIANLHLLTRDLWSRDRLVKMREKLQKEGSLR